MTSDLTPFLSLPETDDPLSSELMLGIFLSGLLFFPPSFPLLQWDPYPIAQTRNLEAILHLQAVLASCIAHLQAASWVSFSLRVAELLPVQGFRVLVCFSLSPSYSISPHITLTTNASCLPHLPCHKHPPGRIQQRSFLFCNWLQKGIGNDVRRDIDGLRDCHTKLSQKEKNKYCILTHICGI